MSNENTDDYFIGNNRCIQCRPAYRLSKDAGGTPFDSAKGEKEPNGMLIANKYHPVISGIPAEVGTYEIFMTFEPVS